MTAISTKDGIGIDALPDNIKNSKILSFKQLSILAGVAEIPFVNPSFADETLKNIIQYYSINPDEMEMELHMYARELLDDNKIYEAWQVLLGVL